MENSLAERVAATHPDTQIRSADYRKANDSGSVLMVDTPDSKQSSAPEAGSPIPVSVVTANNPHGVVVDSRDITLDRVNDASYQFGSVEAPEEVVEASEPVLPPEEPAQPPLQSEPKVSTQVETFTGIDVPALTPTPDSRRADKLLADFNEMELPTRIEVDDPRHIVRFSLPGFAVQAKYHAVEPLTGDVQGYCLIRDSRAAGDSLTPSALQEPIRVEIPSLEVDGQYAILGLNTRLGCYELAVIVDANVSSDEPED